MTYENDIPEYALQPARAPKTIEAEAIYNTEKNCLSGGGTDRKLPV